MRIQVINRADLEGNTGLRFDRPSAGISVSDIGDINGRIDNNFYGEIDYGDTNH